MNLEVLISCMHNKNFDLIDSTNLKDVNALIINQCDCENESVVEEGIDRIRHRMINTPSRGLSVSRNLAVDNAMGDVVLLCDDDEKLVDGLEHIIIDAYNGNPSADVICFRVDAPRKKMMKKRHVLNYVTALKIASWQISFKPDSIKKAGIRFDEKFGSPYGSGEENIFLYDCLRHHLKVIYVPVTIGKIFPTESQWFKGYNEKFFFNQGKKMKRLMGKCWGTLYCLLYALRKRNRYKAEMKTKEAISWMWKGINDETI